MCNTNFFTRTQEPYQFLLERREWKAKRDRIITRDGHACTHCGKKESKEVSLHVHHLHYIFGMDPWEYKDSELITLCPECHASLHISTVVPTYRLVDGQLQKIVLTPCARCHGAGGFPEYRHVQNGVCFRCHGSRYDEFIVACEDYAKEHNINLAEYEDGFRMLSSVEDVVFTEAIIMQSRFDNSKVYVKMTTNDNRYLNAYLDYSVSARPGEKLDIKTIRYKKMYLKNSEKEAIVLKGQVLSA